MQKNILTKRTKIVATIGPASESQQTLEKMMRAGLNVARFNFSHGTYDWHKSVIANVKNAAQQVGVSVAVLADLQGPRIRTKIKNDIVIKKGDIVRLCDITTDAEYKRHLEKDYTVITIDCAHMIEHLSIGDSVLIEDGLMSMKVIDLTDTHAVMEVLAGGTVKNHKGVNIPDAEIPLPTMTQKDLTDLEFALSQGVDYVALSFVRRAQDIVDLRRYMQKILGKDAHLPKIIAKIERKEALTNLTAILGAVDAVMVARGDLGIEADPARVTLYQKDIIAKSLKHLRPVIVATQMLASMEHNPRPTRAEIADVTNAVIDKADATMLSAESTVGKYPVETIRTMATIAIETEASSYDDPDEALTVNRSNDEIRVARGAYEFAREMDAKAIVMYSESGYTARLLSHFRPQRMIFVGTTNLRTYHQLALVWGVTPFLCDADESRRNCIDELIDHAQKRGLLVKGDLVVSVVGSTQSGKQLELLGTKII